MAKLNPPYIENILPPFTFNGNITVPFEFNRMNVESQINYFPRILIKDPLNNKEIVKDFEGIIDIKNKIMTFTCPAAKFISGKYYKIQVAFVNPMTKEIGYYSSVGIARCIIKPEINILGMDSDNGVAVSNMGYKYVGQCILNEPTEKIYSYCFTLQNKKTLEVIYTTGEQIHDTSKDISPTESIDTCYIPATLDFENEYSLEYSITTINGYKDSTSKTLKSGNTVNLDFGNNILIADPDNENGTIIIKIQRKNINEPFTPISYNFILLRSSSKDNFSTWDRISILDEDNSKNLFKLENALLIGDSQILWEDVTVEHGISYKYAIQAYNSFGLLSNKIESNLQQEYNENGLPMYSNDGTLLYSSIPVKIDFEDMFLSDGKRQLRIKFNPKVSSFKNTVLENKVDTIGSKYPFFFRNGTVNYKEFPISGLISLLMDPNDKFITGLYTENISIRKFTPAPSMHVNNLKTNLTDENIKNEREFKLEVLEWLTNGQPKIFRSPTEGNYLVRLMNTSLSPNDTLGRMLHTFSSTAYEIDDYKFETLHKYGFINCETQNYRMASFVGEVDIKLSEYIKDNKKSFNFPGAYQITIKENKPSDAIYKINFSNGESIEELRIGISGIYELPQNIGMTVSSIEWKNWNKLKQRYLDNPCEYNDIELKITYAYYDKINLTNFHFIQNITYTPAIFQHIGKLEFINPKDINAWIADENGHLKPLPASPIATWGVREIDKLYQIRIKQRPLIPIYQDNDGNRFFNKELTDIFSLFSEKLLYQGLYVVKNTNDEIIEILDYYKGIFEEDGNLMILNPQKYRQDEWNTLFQYTLNNQTFSLIPNNITGNIHDINNKYETTVFELDTNLLQSTIIENLVLGNGLMIEIVYLAKDLHYNFDKYFGKAPGQLSNMETAKEKMNVALKEWKSGSRQFFQYLLNKRNYENAYSDYINYLMDAVFQITKDERVTIT